MKAASSDSRLGVTAITANKRESTPWATVFSVVIAACLLGYLLISTTTGVQWIESWHDEQRALQIVLLSLVGPLIFVQLFRDSRLQNIQPPVLLFAIFLLGLVSALRSNHPGHGIAELALFASLCLLVPGVALATNQRHPGAVRTACRLALLLALGHATGILTRYAAALQLQSPLDTMVLLLGYANPRFPSALYALLIPLVAALAVDRSERRDLRCVADVVLILLWCFNIALQTRALAFAYAVAVPAVVMTLGWHGTSAMVKRLVVTALLGTALYCVLFLGVPEWLGTGLAQAGREGLLAGSGREALLLMSWESIRQAPLLGVGPMGFAAIANKIGAHPHNWIVQLAVEWGVPAALLTVVMVAGGLRAASRRIRQHIAATRPVATVAVGAYLAVIVGLIYGLVDGNLVMPVSQTAFFVVTGLLLGTTMPSIASDDESPPPSRAAHAASLAIAAAATVYLAWYTSQTLPRQEARRAWHEQNRVPTPYLLPRFWEQGLIPPAEPPLSLSASRSVP